MASSGAQTSRQSSRNENPDDEVDDDEVLDPRIQVTTF
jgi:hypothetical protein